MKLKFHPEARAELNAAKSFYSRRSPLAALAFKEEIDAGVASLGEAPHRYAEGEFGTREHVLPWRFPYTIVYMTRGDSIVVVAIAHQSREPGYWRERLTR
jgi:plasmid stabilization system protein ParE